MFLIVWVAFAAVWLAVLALLGLVQGVNRGREWLRFRAELRSLDRELDELVPGWRA